MSTPMVIDQNADVEVLVSTPMPTEAFGISGATLRVSPPTMYVSGENLPSVTGQTMPNARRAGGARVLQVSGAAEMMQLEAKAFDAAQALREWYAHAKQMRELGRGPEIETVRACIRRVVDDGSEMDGITAWVLLDGDKPSMRTVQEYRGSVRDVLLWLATRGMCPAETGSADMKAYKAFLQADGAPTQMELMRARWYGREPRITYVGDWRGAAALAAVAGYKAALAEHVKAARALSKAPRNKGLVKFAERAAAGVGEWRGMLALLTATYGRMPLQERFERYTSDTVSLRITLTRNFWKMALSRQAVFENPLLEIKVAKGGTGRAQKIISRFFSDAEVLEVLGACDELRMHTPHAKAAAARDTAMVRLMRNQGLRISEVAALDMSDFNPAAGEAGSLTLRHAKGDKERTTLLSDKTRASLDRWLAYRDLLKPATTAMFVSMNRGARPDAVQPGQRMSIRAIRDMFDELQKAVGIKRPGRSAHGLRHAYATRAMMEDQSQLVSLSLSMGHSSVTITQGYIEAAQLILMNPAKLAEI